MLTKVGSRQDSGARFSRSGIAPPSVLQANRVASVSHAEKHDDDGTIGRVESASAPGHVDPIDE